jgi:hypothetical protein
MRSSLGFLSALSGSFILVAACGGAIRPGSAEDDAGTADSGRPTLVDSGVVTFDAHGPNPPSNVYPAAHQPIPEVTYNGGNILANPNIVTVTFDGDVLRSMVEAFDDLITTTPWWDAVSSEYCDSRKKCIGHGQGGSYARIAANPGVSFTDSASGGQSTLQTYIDARIQDGSFPPPQTDTLYVIYLPTTTKVDLDGSQSCREFGGYHNAMSSTPPGGAGPVQFAYAILPRCSGSKDELTFAASHEIIEAATDPYLSPTAQTYDGFGSQTDAWDYVGGGGEVGDRCVDFSGSGQDRYTESGYIVQRSWSNAAAKASHDPCVPAPAPSQQPYFNVAPSVSDMLVMQVGQTQTVQLTAFSDQPTAPFSVDSTELTSFFGGSNVLDITLDEAQVQNGQKVNMTITLNANPSQGFAGFTVNSSLNGITHTWSFLVTTM